MSISLTVRGTLLKSPVELRSLIGNNNQVTQISDRLANHLGLMIDSHGVYVSPGFGAEGDLPLKWRISSIPMIITGLPEGFRQRTFVVYPVINTDDAFYDMIIGRDCFDQSSDFLSYICNRNAHLMKPNPGPGFAEDVFYMGHNIMLTPYAETPVVDEFLEFPAQGSRSVRRIAFNRVTRQLVVSYTSSDVVYCYEQLPLPLQQSIESGASRGKTMSVVKESCTVLTTASFPDTVLVNPQNSIVV